MKKVFSIIFLILIVLSTAISSYGCCVMNWEYLLLDAQGKVPGEEDFPNTKWSCRELDMYFYMLYYDFGDAMIGGLTLDGEKYNIAIGHRQNVIWVRLYESTFTYSGERNHANYLLEIDGKYMYEDNKLTVFVSKIDNYFERDIDGIKSKIPDELNFDMVGRIAQEKYQGWNAEGIDMYMVSFVDTDGYFLGKYVLDGKVKSFYLAKEYAGNVYGVYAEEGNADEALYLEFKDDKILATVLPHRYGESSDSPYVGTTIVFNLAK